MRKINIFVINTEDHQRHHEKTLAKTEEERQSINKKGRQKL